MGADLLHKANRHLYELVNVFISASLENSGENIKDLYF